MKVMQEQYQLSLERLRRDNEEMAARIRELERNKAVTEEQVHLLNNEKAAWLRVEQGLKDKIHTL